MKLSHKINFNILTHLSLGFPSGFFPSHLRIKISYELISPMFTTCHAHLILLDLITLRYMLISLLPRPTPRLEDHPLASFRTFHI
jgi:hypothetical protein